MKAEPYSDDINFMLIWLLNKLNDGAGEMSVPELKLTIDAIKLIILYNVFLDCYCRSVAISPLEYMIKKYDDKNFRLSCDRCAILHLISDMTVADSIDYDALNKHFNRS